MAATGVGGRVAEERKLAGLTQQQLATRANVSISLIRAVEQGTRPVSPAFVSAVSRALNVDVPDHADHWLFATVPDLRREMAAYRLPR
ncbi:MAG: helix-turn-helix transcriptional regulator [Actinobacteria bacterium]|nr:helix-turn-helix transcriptional regulator [Actinomycetota bacterium]